ncbi:DUF2927 domain-containing protein [Peribacillus acanthi]|uniref:DUF2927 domain-containing protein n=1 Tax=Peribacillus acanthi TaxID=2171554 RepID=UPI000D3EAA8D|nr:DUF2927 domain-containing protein [Peribacillus acanthi]
MRKHSKSLVIALLSILLILIASNHPNNLEIKDENYYLVHNGNTMEFSEDEIEYFKDIALGSEWNEGNNRIIKWNENPRIGIFGEPTKEDLNSLKDVIDDINNLQNSINLSIVEEDANIEIYFVALEDFDKYVQNPMPNNWGLFYFWYDNKHFINKSIILIATNRSTTIERSHLIREELTQSLGLINDSWRYRNSLFYQGWTRTTEFSDLDKKLIKLLYHEGIVAGIDIEEFNKLIVK